MSWKKTSNSVASAVIENYITLTNIQETANGLRDKNIILSLSPVKAGVSKSITTIILELLSNDISNHLI